jgi:hypothetical protein
MKRAGRTNGLGEGAKAYPAPAARGLGDGSVGLLDLVPQSVEELNRSAAVAWQQIKQEYGDG